MAKKLDKVIRMENDQIVLADRARIDKERAAQAAVVATAVGICALSAAHRSSMAPDENGYLSNAAGCAGLMVAGGATVLALSMLEVKRMERIASRNAASTFRGDIDVEIIDPLEVSADELLNGEDPSLSDPD